MKLNRWHDWMVIEELRPVGSHTDEDGQQWADFDMVVKLRWWRWLHPGFWYAIRGRK